MTERTRNSHTPRSRKTNNSRNAQGLTRREFLVQSGRCAAGLAALSSIPSARALIPSSPNAAAKGKAPYLRNPKISHKVVVLGMDGMDPTLARTFAAQGYMPNFKKLMSQGMFGELQTTMPPHSPVAWSSFITGCNPGGHGIYDFIHRDPATFSPYLSTSRSFDSAKELRVGPWTIPLSPGRVDLMRRGPAFWNVLAERDIPSTIVQIPANFPVAESSVKALSGMGTPDLLGSYGTCTFITDSHVENADTFTGTKVVRVSPVNHAFAAKLEGPKNSLRADREPSSIDLVIRRDPYEPVLKITIQNHTLVLKQGEWSEWIPLSFPLMPMFASVAGMVRIYVKEVHPRLKVYISPINVDPMEPSLPICSPMSYSKELSQAVGRFYTQGFPADQKALSEGILSDDEYLTQAHLVMDESMRIFDHELSRFKEGVFFFYFSSVDQNCHMLIRNMDPSHPLYKPDASDAVKNAVRGFYQRMDVALGRALEKVDSSTTLYVLSDHGFAPFTREFHLNTWLYEQGYLALTDDRKIGQGEFFQYVDWSRTKAYGLGINGLYLNVEGRDKYGSVRAENSLQLKNEIAQKLARVTDPKNKAPVITEAYDSHKIYSGPFVDLAPDLVVGYQRGYRSSDETVLGKLPKELVGDRTNLWSADHCMDPAVVPGLLLSNKPWKHPKPGLWDMAPSILSCFGIPTPEEMDGEAIA
jgi:predicted AlkP superfamily phosphohydrolase/phosphomutase